VKEGDKEFTTQINSGTGLFDSGIGAGPAVVKNAKMMLGTTLIYLIIQIPALGYDTDMPKATRKETVDQAAHEGVMALVGLVVSVAAFFAYLTVCYFDSKKDDGGALDTIIKGIQDRKVSLGAALEFASKQTTDAKDTSVLQKVLKPFFVKYDQDGNGTLEFNEFQFLLDDLGEKLIEKEKKKMFRDACMKGSGKDRKEMTRSGTVAISEMKTTEFKKNLAADLTSEKATHLAFKDFVDCMYDYVSDPDKVAHAHKEIMDEPAKKPEEKKKDGGDDDDDEEEEEEMPEDLADLPPEQQRRAILQRALWMMGLGTGIVVFVSDPFVDCLTAWGDRLGIPTFYISFVVAPFASNASELLSAYAYAAKKTKTSITTSLSTLIGAACMNNTFCLAIFFALIYFKKLAWQFTAETAAIMVIQWLIGMIAIFKSVQSFATGFVILACYPLCLAIVYVMENHLGFD
jgi:hypothetical protein